MPEDYVIFEEKGITIVEFLKPPTVRLIRSIIDVLVSSYPYKMRLWDLRKITLDLTLDELIKLSEYGKARFEEKNRAAYLVSDDLSYGRIRQFMVFREEKGHAIPKVFRSYDHAIKWLKS